MAWATLSGLDNMLLADLLRILILVIITLAYALFDIFNKRNVPNLFAYATIAVGVLVALTYGAGTAAYGFLIAIIAAALGYLAYRAGFLGGGDVFEFAFIGLVLPMQAMPLLASIPQLGLPFLLSVFIATGYATIIFTPLYYIIKGKRKLGHKKLEADRNKAIAGFVILAIYAGMILFTNYKIHYSLLGMAILLLAAIPSAAILIYEKYIYEGMILDVYPSKLEEGDMIATNLMSKDDIAYFRERSRHFGRLVDKKVLAKIKGARRKLPVYKNAIPLALFVFIGVAVSLAVGNILLLVFF